MNVDTFETAYDAEIIRFARINRQVLTILLLPETERRELQSYLLLSDDEKKATPKEYRQKMEQRRKEWG